MCWEYLSLKILKDLGEKNSCSALKKASQIFKTLKSSWFDYI